MKLQATDIRSIHAIRVRLNTLRVLRVFRCGDNSLILQFLMDINKIQSALQSLKEERTHLEEYLQNAAAKKKELEKELKSSFNTYNCNQ